MKDRNIKVLHIHGSADIGGAEKIVFDILRKMDRGLFEIRVLFDCASGPMMSYYRSEGIDILGSGGVIRDSLFVRKYNPDIIHLYGLKVNLKWRLFLKLIGFKCVVGSILGLTNKQSIGFWRVKLDVWTARFLTVYVSNSKKVADYLKAKGFPAEKLSVIYNGVEVDKYKSLSVERREDLKKHLGIPLDSIVISCVANLRPVKGHIFLIDALSALRELNFSAIMIGDGTLRDSLIEYSIKKGLNDKTKFLGQRFDIPELLSITDIFVLSSLSEGMPLSIMEAMASGLPVVATNVGGVSELVIDGETGLLVPPRMPKLLAEKIRLLMNNEALRNTMGLKGQVRVKDNFTLEIMVEKTEAVYKGLIYN